MTSEIAIFISIIIGCSVFTATLLRHNSYYGTLALQPAIISIFVVSIGNLNGYNLFILFIILMFLVMLSIITITYSKQTVNSRDKMSKKFSLLKREKDTKDESKIINGEIK